MGWVGPGEEWSGMVCVCGKGVLGVCRLRWGTKEPLVPLVPPGWAFETLTLLVFVKYILVPSKVRTRRARALCLSLSLSRSLALALALALISLSRSLSRFLSSRALSLTSCLGSRVYEAFRERVCCLLVLNLVSSTLSCIQEYEAFRAGQINVSSINVSSCPLTTSFSNRASFVGIVRDC